jgi:hypothetical protein
MWEGIQGAEWACAACGERELWDHEIPTGTGSGQEWYSEHGREDDHWIVWWVGLGGLGVLARIMAYVLFEGA